MYSEFPISPNLLSTNYKYSDLNYLLRTTFEEKFKDYHVKVLHGYENYNDNYPSKREVLGLRSYAIQLSQIIESIHLYCIRLGNLEKTHEYITEWQSPEILIWKESNQEMNPDRILMRPQPRPFLDIYACKEDEVPNIVMPLLEFTYDEEYAIPLRSIVWYPPLKDEITRLEPVPSKAMLVSGSNDELTEKFRPAKKYVDAAYFSPTFVPVTRLFVHRTPYLLIPCKSI